MQIKLKLNRINEELTALQSSPSMQRDLIRNLRSGGRDIFFLNIFRLELNYLSLDPAEGLPKLWKTEQALTRNVHELYRLGFLNEDERECCERISAAILSTLRRHRLFLFLHCLTHKQKGGL